MSLLSRTRGRPGVPRRSRSSGPARGGPSPGSPPPARPGRGTTRRGEAGRSGSGRAARRPSRRAPGGGRPRTARTGRGRRGARPRPRSRRSGVPPAAPEGATPPPVRPGPRTSIDRVVRHGRARPVPRHEQDGGDAEGEAADVREERDPAAGLWLEEREAAVPDLEPDPDEQEPEGRDLPDEDDPEGDERQHAGAWEEHEVRAENARDRAARSDVRDARPRTGGEVERDDRLEGHGGDAGREVPGEEPDRADRVLDVVSEDPEEEHVPEDVLPARVHEHAGEDALVPRQGMEARRQVARPLYRARVEAVAGDVDVDAGARKLPEPDQEARDDQADGDVREASGGDVVLEWNHCRASRTRSATASSSMPCPLTSARISSAVGFCPSFHSSRSSEPASRLANHALPKRSRRCARNCASNAHARRYSEQ